MSNNKKYLFVDLDGTFAKNDLFQELLIKCLLQKPYDTVNAYLRGGVLQLKHFVFRNHKFSTDQVMVNSKVLSLIKEKKKSGYQICLATASPQMYAEYIGKTWSIFDFALGSNEEVNLKGRAKLDMIVSFSKGAHFEYIGDSKADQIIFNKCPRFFKLTNNQVYEFTN